MSCHPAIAELLDPPAWDESSQWLCVTDRNALADRLLDEMNATDLVTRLATDFSAACRVLFTTHDTRRTPAKIPFRLWGYQEWLGSEFLSAIEGQHDLVVVKGRDLGASEVLGKVLQHCWIFKKDFHALITSRKKEMVDSQLEPDTLFERMRLNVKCMPERLRRLLLGDDVMQKPNMTFARMVNPLSGSTITGEPPVDDFGRQGRYSCIAIDEAAFCDNLAKMMVGSADASNCHLYVSTPNGYGEPFHRMILAGQKRVCRVHWLMHPIKSKGSYLRNNPKVSMDRRSWGRAHGWFRTRKHKNQAASFVLPDNFRQYTSAWWEAKRAEAAGDQVLLAQEHQLEFLASGNPRFDPLVLKEAEKTIRKPLRCLEFKYEEGALKWNEGGENLALCIFEEPQPEHCYVVGADPASGTAAGRQQPRSNSAAVVLDTSSWPANLRVVACYKSVQADPLLFGHILAWLGRRWNEARICVESNSIGQAVLMVLNRGMGGSSLYDNLFYEPRPGGYPDQHNRVLRAGYAMNLKSKALVEHRIEQALPGLVVADERILADLMAYVWSVKTGEPKGKPAPGSTADLVVALGLALTCAESWHGNIDAAPAERLTFDELLGREADGTLETDEMNAYVMGARRSSPIHAQPGRE